MKIPVPANSLKKNTIFYGCSIISERFISFLLVPIITKTLSQELYGLWSQFIITAGILAVIVTIGFHTTIVRFLSGNDGRNAGLQFYAMFWLVLFNCGACLLAAWFFARPLSTLVFGNARFASFVPLMCFYLTTEALFELFTGFLRAREKISLLAIYYFVKSVFRIGVFCVGLLILHIPLFAVIVSMVILQFLMLIFIYFNDIHTTARFSFVLRGIGWKQIMAFSLPLIPYGFLIWSNNFVDRYLILHMLGMNQVSVYAIAYSLAAVVGIFYSVLGYTLYPRMSSLWNGGDAAGAGRILRIATEYYLFFAMPFIAGITILSAPLIKIFATELYVSSWMVVFLLGAGVAVFGLYQLHVYATLQAKMTMFNLKIACIALVANIILNLFLIPHLGIFGAALSTLISNIILAVSTVIAARHVLPYSFPWRSLISLAVPTAIIALFLLSIKNYTSSGLLRLTFSTLGAIVLYVAVNMLGRNRILVALRGNT